MRSRLILLPLAAILAACGGSSDSTGPGTGTTGGTGGTTPVATTSVEMSGSQFSPRAIKVAPGATVTWTNSDGISHNVTFDAAGLTGVGAFATGTRTAVMPTVTGTYTYRCTFHNGMTGSVAVQ
jgi:plastocyanin